MKKLKLRLSRSTVRALSHGSLPAAVGGARTTVNGGSEDCFSVQFNCPKTGSEHAADTCA